MDDIRYNRVIRALKSHLRSLEQFKVQADKGDEVALECLFDEIEQMEEAFQLVCNSPST